MNFFGEGELEEVTDEEFKKCPPHTPGRTYEWDESVTSVCPEMRGYFATCKDCHTDYKIPDKG